MELFIIVYKERTQCVWFWYIFNYFNYLFVFIKTLLFCSVVLILFYLRLWYPHILCKNKFISNSAQTCILRKTFKIWFKLRLKFVQNLTSLSLLMSLYSMTTIIGKYIVYHRNKVFFNRFQSKKKWTCLKCHFWNFEKMKKKKKSILQNKVSQNQIYGV